MKRVLILGRGGAGKSTTAKQLGKLTGLPVIELDKYFWQTGLKPMPKNEWVELQHELTSGKQWIIDGDLGKYDVLEARLRAADTILVLDFSLVTCAMRALKRSWEKPDFWWWLITWRLISRPKIMKAIKVHAPKAKVDTLRSPKALEQLMSSIGTP